MEFFLWGWERIFRIKECFGNNYLRCFGNTQKLFFLISIFSRKSFSKLLSANFQRLFQTSSGNRFQDFFVKLVSDFTVFTELLLESFSYSLFPINPCEIQEESVKKKYKSILNINPYGIWNQNCEEAPSRNLQRGS